jgi:MMPL family
MARVREEVERRGSHRDGVIAGLVGTGGVITNAGIILAGTFLVLRGGDTSGPEPLGQERRGLRRLGARGEKRGGVVLRRVRELRLELAERGGEDDPQGDRGPLPAARREEGGPAYRPPSVSDISWTTTA